MDYLDIGPRDASPTLYCHGTPGSRTELLLARPALERGDVPIRLIALNRPGYGTSSFHPYRGFRPFAGLVDEAADRLGLDHFSILGASGGAPFALACALSLADRIDKVAVVAGVAPPETSGMEEAATLTDEFERTTLRAVRYGFLSLAVSIGLTRRLVSRLIASLGPADRQALTETRATEILQGIVQEGFAQLGRAAVLEAGLFLRSWDFDPTGITRAVGFWHGTKDTRIPARVSTAMAERLPHAFSVHWPHHGHFSWAMGNEVVEVARFLTGPDQRSSVSRMGP